MDATNAIVSAPVAGDRKSSLVRGALLRVLGMPAARSCAGHGRHRADLQGTQRDRQQTLQHLAVAESPGDYHHRAPAKFHWRTRDPPVDPGAESYFDRRTAAGRSG